MKHPCHNCKDFWWAEYNCNCMEICERLVEYKTKELSEKLYPGEGAKAINALANKIKEAAEEAGK